MIHVLDASALLAFLKKESGYEAIQTLWAKASQERQTIFMHQINYLEVIKKLLQYYGERDTKRIMAGLHSPEFGISNFLSDEMALQASQFFVRPGISMADSIGLAFTQVMQGTFWTADRAMSDIAPFVKIIR